MTKFSPIESEFGDQAEADAHDAWVRMKVERAMNSTRPTIPHEEVMARVRATIDRHRVKANVAR